MKGNNFGWIFSICFMLVHSAMEAAVPARWISGDTASPDKPAPVMLREFTLDTMPQMAVFSVAVAGWCEVRVNWNDANSHNHIMFGDLSAWAYEYAVGIVPV